MPRRKFPHATMPRKQPDQPAARLDMLHGHIKSCIATYDYHGVIAAEDLRWATARWPDLRQLPMKPTLDLALSRLELLMAERDAVEQAPAMVTGTGGAQPVPAQAPASRPATPP